MPKWIFAFIVASTAFALIPLAIAAKARSSHSDSPHIHIFPDMDFQPKFKADTASDIFGDGRANRGHIAGTIARGSLNADDTFYRGIENGQWTLGFPKQLEISEQLVRRGQNRFNIYCSPCHDRTGGGKGIVIGYGLVPPPSFHDDKVLAFADGYIMNVITNGVRTMPSYGAQIPPDDRWAIIAYLRTLERSQRASLADVPSDHRQDLK